MIYRTLSEAKTALSVLSGQTGYSTSDTRLTTDINRAIEELMRTGEYPCITDRYEFTVIDGYLTLPFYLQRADGIAIDQLVLDRKNAWFEFSKFGIGPIDQKTDTEMVLDREEAVTIRKIPTDTNYQIKVVADAIDERVASVRPRILLKGYDENNKWVRTLDGGQYIDGEYVEINGDASPYETLTTNNFSSLTEVIKPATKGFIKLYTSNALRTDLLLADYYPQETNINYRRYYIPYLDDGKTHTASVRGTKRFVPAVNDSDLVLIPNMDALELMIMAQQKRRNQEMNEYASMRRIAVELMKEESTKYNEKNKNPVIQYSKNFAIGGFESLI